MKLLNAFSINMLPDGFFGYVKFTPVTAQRAGELLRGAAMLESCVGHADTARVLSDVLGFDVAYMRVAVTLEPGEPCIVAQYVGSRLPEGATALPDGARFIFYVVVA